MNILTVICVALGVLGLMFLTLAISRLRRGRLAAAGIHGTAGCCLMLLGGALVAVAFNLYTYQRLTFERTVADITFRQFETKGYGATLNTQDGRDPQRFVIRGDEWQIDARVLKWHGFANLVGLDSQFRLERLSGRFADLEVEREGPRTVYALSRRAGLDVWEIANHYKRWVPLVDAVYGSAAYMPMANGARFEISMSQTGLIARPSNPAAVEALAEWR